MGGFMLFQGGKAVRTLTPEDLELLSDSDNIDFPDITQKEIQDKSKGDFSPKGLWLFRQAGSYSNAPHVELSICPSRNWRL
jgi:hypothetical protein